MIYRLAYSKTYDRQFGKLDRQTQKMLISWIEKNLMNLENPRQHGKALTGDKKGFWRYRVGNYRIIADIQDDKLVILALSVGHRKQIYK